MKPYTGLTSIQSFTTACHTQAPNSRQKQLRGILENIQKDRSATHFWVLTLNPKLQVGT